MSRLLASPSSASLPLVLEDQRPLLVLQVLIEHVEQAMGGLFAAQAAELVQRLPLQVEQLGQLFVAAVGVFDFLGQLALRLPSTIRSCLRSCSACCSRASWRLSSRRSRSCNSWRSLANFAFAVGLLLDGRLFHFQFGLAAEIRRFALGFFDDFFGFGFGIAAAEPVEKLDGDRPQHGRCHADHGSHCVTNVCKSRHVPSLIWAFYRRVFVVGRRQPIGCRAIANHAHGHENLDAKNSPSNGERELDRRRPLASIRTTACYEEPNRPALQSTASILADEASGLRAGNPRKPAARRNDVRLGPKGAGAACQKQRPICSQSLLDHGAVAHGQSQSPCTRQPLLRRDDTDQVGRGTSFDGPDRAGPNADAAVQGEARLPSHCPSRSRQMKTKKFILPPSRQRMIGVVQTIPDLVANHREKPSAARLTSAAKDPRNSMVHSGPAAAILRPIFKSALSNRPPKNDRRNQFSIKC